MQIGMTTQQAVSGEGMRAFFLIKAWTRGSVRDEIVMG